MEYIIIWKSHHREPHLDQDSHGFKETFSSYEDAKAEAERVLEQEGPNSVWYYDYEIFQTAES